MPLARSTVIACLAFVPAVSEASAQATRVSARRAAPATRAGVTTGPARGAGTVGAITAADLSHRVHSFADDSMAGRDAGTAGEARARRYLVAELRRLGLRPAGERGTWEQVVPLVERRLGADASLDVGGQPLARLVDWAPVTTRGTIRSLDGTYETVYAGAVQDPFRLTRAQVAGKIVVVGARPGPAPRQRFESDEPMAAAAAVFVVLLDRVPAAERAALDAPSVWLPGADADEPMPNEFLIGAAAAERLLGAPLDGLAPGTAGLRVQARLPVVETPRPGRNVVARLPGRDPARRGQVVVLAAHHDHHGIAARAADHDSLRAGLLARRAAFVRLDDDGDEVLTGDQQRAFAEATRALRVNVDSLRRLRPARADSIMNGADDNASGSMALLEIAESLVARGARPRRSLLFVWHTAEERTMLGSRWFGAHPPVARDSIVAALTVDQIGRGTAADQRCGGPNFLMAIGSRAGAPALDSAIDAVNARRAQPFAIDRTLNRPGHPSRLRCRSDHAEYARWGIPAVVLHTGTHADYHQVTDEAAYLHYPHLAAVTTFLHDLAWSIADAPARLARPAAAPNATAVCRQ